MVARLTPDQKVACSIHVGFKSQIRFPFAVWICHLEPDPSGPLSIFLTAQIR
ncbi:unnamed protein product [Spirodela intermedia]|uniref:Uncharacterized protein n=1 Tax=Spirodela intermedia TaxID=51605 RepID=A0A7I8ICE4_SPIIN|nr:unnamed protein product [Spirodela intermedia]CAA6655426.1 unnamed protein product [Spirodela intermedia]